MGFNIADGIIALLLLGGLIGGLRRGLSGELARLLVAGAIVLVLYRFARPVADWLMQRYQLAPNVALLTSSAVLILGGYIALTLVRLALAAVFNFSFKGALERIGGAIAGFFRAGAVCAIALTLLAQIPHEGLHRVTAEESRIGRWMLRWTLPVVERIVEKVPELRPFEPQPPAGVEDDVDWMEDDFGAR